MHVKETYTGLTGTVSLIWIVIDSTRRVGTKAKESIYIDSLVGGGNSVESMMNL